MIHDIKSVGLGQFFLLLDVLMEVTMRAVLHNDVVVVWSLDDFIQSHNIIMNKGSMNLNFCLKHFKVGSSELLQLYDFYGITFMRFFDFYPFVHFT